MVLIQSFINVSTKTILTAEKKANKVAEDLDDLAEAGLTFFFFFFKSCALT